jgi:ribosomal protein S1
LRYLFEKNETFPFFAVKTVKGGVLGTTLGSLCFIPKSLYKKDSLNQSLVNVKLFSKRKRPFSKANLNFSLVSSLKAKRNNRKETI